jgi:hypothetical protein
MPLILKDRVKENSVTSSTGTLTLTGAPQGFQTFSSAIGNGNTTYYAITEQGTGNFEVGLGTVGAGTLSRDTILESSNAGSLVNFGSATKDVFCTYPAEKAILGNTSAVASTGTGSVVLSSSPTLTGTVGLPLSSFGSALTNIGLNEGFANTVQIGSGTEFAATDIYIGQSQVGDITGTNTYINGTSFFDTNTSVTFGAGTFGSNLTVNGNLTATSALLLAGAATTNQNIATNQTTGNLVIGGSGAQSGTIIVGGATGTGTITIGRSTGVQTVGIATGVNTASIKTVSIGTGGTFTTNITIGNSSGNSTISMGLSTADQTVNIATGNTGLGVTKTVNIGTGASGASSSTGINIGTTTGPNTITLGQTTATQTVNIGTGVTAASTTKTINIGTAGNASSTTNINIGLSTNTSTTTVNGTLRQQTYLVANLPTGIAGAQSFVTNALTPAFGSAVVGGGAVGVPVYHDGTSWKVG